MPKIRLPKLTGIKIPRPKLKGIRIRRPKPKVTKRKEVKIQRVRKDAAIHGTVKYPWGTPKGVTVMVGPKSVIPDDAGRYEIQGLAPGVYEVAVHAPFPGYEAPAQKVEIAAGEAKSLDIYLDFKQTIVEGHVYDSEGKPISGASVSGILSGSDVETKKTDEQGYFKFEKTSPGSQFVRVNAVDHMGETRDFVAKEGAPTVLEFRLTRGSCKVYGIVSDEQGHPVSGEIILSSATGVILYKTRSDAQTGSYEVPLLPGRYNLLAVPADNAYEQKGWYGPVSADTKLDLVLEPKPWARMKAPDQKGDTPPTPPDEYYQQSPW